MRDDMERVIDMATVSSRGQVCMRIEAGDDIGLSMDASEAAYDDNYSAT